MAYSWLTFAQGKTLLKNRLGDPNGVFWLDTECGLYIKESLRTFNSIANFHRDRCTFNTQSGFAFYDLTKTSNPDLITAGTGALATNPPNFAGYSLLDRNLLVDIEYSLIEPITTNFVAGTPSLTEQFTIDDIVDAVQDARSEFLLATGIHITHSQINYSSSDGREDLSDSIIDIRRVGWLRNSVFTPLFKSDEWESGSYNPGWETSVASTPRNYSTILTPKVGIQLIPNSSLTSVLDLLTVNNPSDLDTTTGVLLNIPDDFSWVLKWGALAELLSKEGQAYDPVRAMYCKQRYEEGIQFAIDYQLINQTFIENIVVRSQSLRDFDTYDYNWQNVSGEPTKIGIAGRNLIALSPVPDGVYEVTIDLLRNAPIPSADGDFIQIGREQWSLIMDYATHLAMFKCQGTEFEGTYQLLDNFMKGSMLHNDRWSAQARDYNIMKKLSSKEEVDRKRIEKVA